MSEEQGITVDKEEEFMKWYNETVLKSGLADYGPVTGCMIIKPYGYELWEAIKSYLNPKLKKLGVKNAYFPLLIPERLLKKEASHFEGFTPEVPWVTHGGETKLGERLAVRPTSETIIHETFSKWISGWRDLPLKINQWCNVMRWETKTTRLFLRTKEFLWQEGHTAFSDKKEAEKEVIDILKTYKLMAEDLMAIPVLTGIKTEMEKFAGAEYTTTIEALMPDGKALQAGTSHHLGQNFSKAFDIKFKDKDEKEKYAYLNSWGVSTRLIGALVMVHSDSKGLVLPPKIASVQAVIIPIIFKGKSSFVLKKCRELKEKIKKLGVRVELDDRENYSAGFKFNEWELKGVPIRIEVGPKDVEKKQITIVKRNSGSKEAVKETQIKMLLKALDEIQKEMFKKASNFLKKNITEVKTYDEFKKVLAEKKGFLKTQWCNQSSCEEKIKEETGATTRLIPFKQEKISGNCFYCGKKAETIVYFAKAY